LSIPSTPKTSPTRCCPTRWAPRRWRPPARPSCCWPTSRWTC
jgi:hypothetical protein